MGEEGNEVIGLLRRVPLLSDLDEDEIGRVARVVVPRAFPKGDVVFHEGDQSDACYVIRSGDVRVTRQHSDGRVITLATLGGGEIVGELAMLDGEVRSATVEALTDVELLALSAVDMRSLLKRNPDLTAKLVVALTRRVRETNERVSSQSFQTVPSRVAGVLDQLVADGDHPQGSEGMTIRMTQADLAQMAGTSRESVSRFLAILERAGVVRVGRGRVTVTDPSRLRSYIF
ncbi:MAG: Crp/Fnr family transcriptional regulator [Solirubrobacterales bacterium]